MNDVSFVIVCYNHARYADRVARFLRAQEGIDDAEYIFVDDGSTDGTADAIARATEGWRNTRIHRQANTGPSNALNQGIRRATRPFIKLVGGDDLLHPRATVMLRDRLVARNAVYAFGRLGAFDPEIAVDDTKYWSRLMPPIGAMSDTLIDDPLAFLIRNMSHNPSCILLRTADAQAAGGSDESVFVEDYSLSLRMALRGGFVHLPVEVAFAPEGDEQRLSTDGAQTLHDVNSALAGLVRDHPELRWRYRSRIARRAAGRGWHWARRKGGESIFSRIWLLSMLGHLRLLPPSSSIMEAACQPFRATNVIRLPGQRTVPPMGGKRDDLGHVRR